MHGIERARGARIPCRGAGAGEPAHVGRSLVTGYAAADRRRRGGAWEGEGRIRDAPRAEPEATRIHVARAVTARAVAVEGLDRDVIAGCGDDGDIKSRGHRRTVTGETPGDALVRAGDRVGFVVARRRVALRARRIGRNVVRRPYRGAGERDRVMAHAAITGLRVIGVERRRG